MVLLRVKEGLCRKDSNDFIVELVLNLLIGGIRIFMRDLDDCLLSVGHKFNIYDFAYNPLVVFCLAVNEVSSVEIFSCYVFNFSVMVNHELLQICAKLVNKNIVGFFEVELL